MRVRVASGWGAGIVVAIIAGLTSCGVLFGTNPPPLQGDTIAANTLVLYSAYVKDDSIVLYDAPSEEAVVEQRYRNTELEVIGEQGDWLEVKENITRIYEMAPPDEEGFHFEKRRQLERIYVLREDVLLRADFLLKQVDLEKTAYARCLNGERLEREKRVFPDRFLHLELITQEEFDAQRNTQNSWAEFEAHLRRGDEFFAPLNASTFLAKESYGAEAADTVEAARRREQLDSLTRLYGSNRIVTMDSLDAQHHTDIFGEGMVLEVCGNEYDSREEECCCGEEMIAQTYYLGELPFANLLALRKEEEEFNWTIFLNRRNLKKSFAFSEFALYIAPDSTYMMGVGASWYQASGLVLSIARLSEKGSELAAELHFPQMELLVKEQETAPIYGHDGSLYVCVYPSNAPSPAEFVQYVRVRPRKEWLEGK